MTKARPPRGPIAIREGAIASTTVPTTARVRGVDDRDVAALLGDEGVEAVRGDRDAVGFGPGRKAQSAARDTVSSPCRSTVTSSSPESVTQTVRPSGAIATPRGSRRDRDRRDHGVARGGDNRDGAVGLVRNVGELRDPVGRDRHVDRRLGREPAPSRAGGIASARLRAPRQSSSSRLESGDALLRCLSADATGVAVLGFASGRDTRSRRSDRTARRPSARSTAG